MASLSEKSQVTLEQYRLGPRTAATSFPANGFGPFTLVRDELIEEILNTASPEIAVHVTGCKGSGKTVLLRQMYEKLVSEADVYGIEDTMVFFFRECSGHFPRIACVGCASGVDEVQEKGLRTLGRDARQFHARQCFHSSDKEHNATQCDRHWSRNFGPRLSQHVQPIRIHSYQ